MDLQFDVAGRLGFCSNGHEGPRAGKVPRALLDKFADTICALSELSAVARGLKTQYEDNRLADIRSTDDMVYLLVEGTDVLGFLRFGIRNIKVSASNTEAVDKQAAQTSVSGYAAYSCNLKSMSPCCLFDFFVVNGFERRGLGKLLFDAMLSGEDGIMPASIAYAHPSDAMYAFLSKHFGLSTGKAVSTFIVFEGFFSSSVVTPKPATESVVKKDICTKEIEMDEPVIEEVEVLDSDPLEPYKVDEEEFYTERTKLYCFNANEWQDAGAGQVSMLKNISSGRVRLVFVQEVAKRVIANHFIINRAPFCELQRHTAGNEKTWMWTAQERVLERRFALKFRSVEDANKFKEIFDSVKKLSAESNPVEYVILRKVGVTVESALPSQHVKLLSPGAIVSVVEVIYSSESKQVRARLVQPEGWITLLSHNSSDAASYAVARGDLDNYVAVTSRNTDK